MTSTRISTFKVEGPRITFYVSDCGNCGVVFGIPEDLERRRRNDGGTFYCPSGHPLHFSDETTAQEKLKAATARETGLQDQLRAAIRDAEGSRSELLRIRSRIANGVCPCCNRSFDNVRRHVASKHPEFSLPNGTAKRIKFGCSCGRKFPTYAGLRIHQGRNRTETGKYRWDAPKQDRWYAHLTEGASRV
jgi:hypothetical protein